MGTMYPIRSMFAICSFKNFGTGLFRPLEAKLLFGGGAPELFGGEAANLLILLLWEGAQCSSIDCVKKTASIIFGQIGISSKFNVLFTLDCAPYAMTGEVARAIAHPLRTLSGLLAVAFSGQQIIEWQPSPFSHEHGFAKRHCIPSPAI
jgi:hypothetical protein